MTGILISGLLGTLIRVSQDELVKHGSDSIPLKDGGYAAGLGVAHSLHCVVCDRAALLMKDMNLWNPGAQKLIKKFIYREHSYPGVALGSNEFHHSQTHAGE